MLNDKIKCDLFCEFMRLKFILLIIKYKYPILGGKLTNNKHFFSYLLIIIYLLFGLPITNTQASLQNNVLPKIYQNSDLQSGSLLKDASSTTEAIKSSFGLTNDNPPEPTNPCYQEYQLADLKTKDVTVDLAVGSSSGGNKVHLPNLTAHDLSELTMDKITIADRSKLQASDLTQLTYDSTKQELKISLTDSALMKTNGAGTQLVLNIQSKDGQRKDQAVIGIWRNYIEHPYFELDVGNKLYLQYMLNNDSTYPNTEPISTKFDNIYNRATPNYRLRDAAKNNKIIDTMYHADGKTMADWTNNGTFIGEIGKDDKLNIDVYNNPRLDPNDHIYVGTDPDHPKRIIYQFDTTLKVKMDNGLVVNLRLRVFSYLEPSSNNQQIIFKQKFVNYTTDSSNKPVVLPPIWIYRKYDTDLNGDDYVPIYLSSINSNGYPNGLYFKDDSKVYADPYRLDFTFNIDDGPQGWDAFQYSDNMVDFVGRNKTGFEANQKIFPPSDVNVDSAIAMVWSPSKIGATDFGSSSPTMSYITSSSMALAPTISGAKEELSYPHDPDNENPLPPLTINGKVNTTNRAVKKVNLYYLVDTNDIPKNPEGRKSLGEVNIPEDQHNIDNLTSFSGKIEDQNDLKTLAALKDAGHTIYVYGIDDQGMQSNLWKLKVLPNIKIPLHYVDELGHKITNDRYLVGTEGSSYDLTQGNYLPQKIVTKDAKYKLADTTENPDLKGTFDKSVTEINIKYQKNGALTIKTVPNLDFGNITLSSHRLLFPISKQNNDLEITDSTGEPVEWKLLMQATPFYRIDPSDANQLIKSDKLDDLLKYRLTDTDLRSITDTAQEIGRYSDLPYDASTKNGEIVTTNFQKVWWSSDNPPKQLQGPMLQTPNNFQTKPGQYRSTVTWSLENVLD